MSDENKIRWQIGEDSYDREEIEYMLQTQRAMIHNDTLSILSQQAEEHGLKGKLTKDGSEIIKHIRNCRKVKF